MFDWSTNSSICDFLSYVLLIYNQSNCQYYNIDSGNLLWPIANFTNFDNSYDSSSTKWLNLSENWSMDSDLTKQWEYLITECIDYLNYDL